MAGWKNFLQRAHPISLLQGASTLSSPMLSASGYGASALA